MKTALALLALFALMLIPLALVGAFVGLFTFPIDDPRWAFAAGVLAGYFLLGFDRYLKAWLR